MNDGVQDERFLKLLGLPLTEVVCHLQDRGYQVSLGFTGPGGVSTGDARVVRITSTTPSEAMVVAACGWDTITLPPAKE